MSNDTVEVIPSYNVDDDDSDDEIQILEFRKITQDLLDNPQQQNSNESTSTSNETQAPKVTKKLSESQCPICFDDIDNATVTSCGHIFCLNCIEQSISSSHARGNSSIPRGKGLCPLCRKMVSFKETIVLKLRKGETKFTDFKN
ncbi:hypothetical protein KGF54_002497 [Candida jiufengensis]|uniref:uncharacterized protein n=1 Tax=Candida jiufengensis TaxID=497108 RepID=UPI002224829C|nr:uncharacterized protein KGF54_002497 [Candida jiufengensis]KAI5953126.1 hypothetical protein KGF54_002497 [Candida jiufengensis]